MVTHEKLKWREAADYCGERCGYLAAVRSENENDDIAALLGSHEHRPGAFNPRDVSHISTFLWCGMYMYMYVVLRR